MFVKGIKDYDKFSNEADVIVSDGQYDILCYCYQTSYHCIGNKVENITSLFACEIMRVDNNNFCIDKLDTYYSYHLQGEVVNIEKPVIRIGNLYINIDSHLPKDIKKGEWIELKVERLDCSL